MNFYFLIQRRKHIEERDEERHENGLIACQAALYCSLFGKREQFEEQRSFWPYIKHR